MHTSERIMSAREARLFLALRDAFDSLAQDTLPADVPSEMRYPCGFRSLAHGEMLRLCREIGTEYWLDTRAAVVGGLAYVRQDREILLRRLGEAWPQTLFHGREAAPHEASRFGGAPSGVLLVIDGKGAGRCPAKDEEIEMAVRRFLRLAGQASGRRRQRLAAQRALRAPSAVREVA
jgi:hypothetical protein